MNQTWSDAQTMITLSAIAYQDDVPGLLKQAPPAAGWSLVWGPAVYEYNRAYVVHEPATGRYAVAIRGSETTFSWDTFYNWLNDLAVFTQVDWPYFPAAPASKVSYGAYIQLRNLCQATWDGQSLSSFLTALPPGTPLLVTGHSLGGNLATVLAGWVSSQRGPAAGAPDPNTIVYTFAAPAAGNTAFAGAFTTRFPNSWRYWNALDVVPHAWDTLVKIIGIYDGIGIPTPLEIAAAVLTAQGLLAASEGYYDSSYEQPNAAGTELPAPQERGLFTDVWTWLTEVAAQHASATYLQLLQAPPLPPATLSEIADRGLIPMPAPPVLSKGAVAPRR